MRRRWSISWSIFLKIFQDIRAGESALLGEDSESEEFLILNYIFEEPAFGVGTQQTEGESQLPQR
jgi:hypothetical protein